MAAADTSGMPSVPKVTVGNDVSDAADTRLFLTVPHAAIAVAAARLRNRRLRDNTLVLMGPPISRRSDAPFLPRVSPRPMIHVSSHGRPATGSIGSVPHPPHPAQRALPTAGLPDLILTTGATAATCLSSAASRTSRAFATLLYYACLSPHSYRRGHSAATFPVTQVTTLFLCPGMGQQRRARLGNDFIFPSDGNASFGPRVSGRLR